jgi:hypothetical protein
MHWLVVLAKWNMLMPFVWDVVDRVFDSVDICGEIAIATKMSKITKSPPRRSWITSQMGKTQFVLLAAFGIWRLDGQQYRCLEYPNFRACSLPEITSKVFDPVNEKCLFNFPGGYHFVFQGDSAIKWRAKPLEAKLFQFRSFLNAQPGKTADQVDLG